jgi:L-lactate dehydrogenase complex protein LldE
MALVRILERLGHQVEFPPDQTCCGQIHFNTGYTQEAASLMERHLRVFEGAEAVVAPSASCVAMVREQYPLLAGKLAGNQPASDVEALAARTFEMTEFLVNVLGVEDVGAAFPARVALHPTCHSRRSIDVGDAPERLLRAVKGLTLVGLPNAEECCGFGGTFSVKNSGVSLAMLQDKMEDARSSGADVLTAVDNSCLMHIAGGLRREGRVRPRVLHLAEILASRSGGVGE